MVFGTFDGLHKGHENFFQQARVLARPAKPFLIVSVARDKNVKRIKGRKPSLNEKQRLRKLKKHPLVSKALLGDLGNHIPHIIKQEPDLIALGYDQKHYVKGLRSTLKAKGLKVKIVRLKSYHPEKFKSSIIKKRT